MTHWYVVGVLVLGAGAVVAYFVWDLVRSYCDLKDRYDAQRRELTQLSQERFNLQGGLMRAEQECQKLRKRIEIDEQNVEQWINAANAASDRVAELVETIAQHERILAVARDDLSKVHHALGGSPVLRPRTEDKA